MSRGLGSDLFTGRVVGPAAAVPVRAIVGTGTCDDFRSDPYGGSRRLRVEENPVFVMLRENRSHSRGPIPEVFRNRPPELLLDTASFSYAVGAVLGGGSPR